MFRRFSTELAAIYAVLFSVVLGIIAIAVYFVVETNSNNAIRAELNASSAVFDRLWSLREDQLSDTASVLARDFGFRQAVATGDAETIDSALDNIAARFGLDLAFVIGLDGDVAGGSLSEREDLAQLRDRLVESESARGVFLDQGAPFQAVSAPINAPTLIGWVVFGRLLVTEDLMELEALSALPLSAHLYLRESGGAWAAVGDGIGASAEEEQQLTDQILGDPEDNAFFRLSSGAAVAGSKPLRSFDGQSSAALILEYSLAGSQAHYRAIFFAILLIGAGGLVLLVAGSWLVSRRITGPISRLRDAATRLAEGDLTSVEIKGRNEIAALASNFNHMSSEIAAREDRILHLARHDNETGFPNLHGLIHHLSELRTQHPAQTIYGMAIGLDRFEKIRSAIGHDWSAQLIQKVAQRVQRCDERLFVGRLSTDTIGAIFLAPGADAARLTAETIHSASSDPISLGGDRIDAPLTIGLSSDAETQESGLLLLERAEVAVAQARKRRDAIGMFDQAAYGDPSSALSMMSRMIEGLGQGEFFLAHQPKLDLASGGVSSAESLIRWRQPNGEMIRPDQFIPMTEETGHIKPLTEWVLDQAIHDQRRLRDTGHDIKLSINVSGRLIADEDFIERAITKIRRSDAKICFEITETAVIDNSKLALAMMKKLTRASVDISIDDYGSGLSSLSYLKLIPAHELKIDRMFIEQVDVSESDVLLVKSTVDLAHSLGMSVTAEGIETQTVLDRLKTIGADVIQGYLFAKPMPLAELSVFLSHHAGRKQERA